MQEISQQEYIPSREGEKILGVRRNTFFYYVQSGQIRKKELEQGPSLYNYADILRIKETRDKKKGKKLTTNVDWMKPSDLPAILKLDFEVYKEEMVGDIGLYISWYKKNPQITLLSFDRDNRERVLAYVSLVPLPEDIIHSILRGERTELTISPDDVETYDRNGFYTLLAESAVVHPDHPEQLNNVLRAFLDHWSTLYPEKQIKKIYAQAASEDGDVLIRKMYFSPLYDFADNAYVLDMSKKGASIFVRRFQDSLKHKK